VPLVYEAQNWQSGVFLGSIMSSEKTAAAKGEVGAVRHDPFAMLPFCGYHMGDYFKHWLEVGAKAKGAKLPKIYYVNWFRKNSKGEWLWPGFGDNIRVLKWIFENGERVKTPIGNVPTTKGLDLTNLKISAANLQEILTVDKAEWKEEVKEIEQFYSTVIKKMPKELWSDLENLKKNLL